MKDKKLKGTNISEVEWDENNILNDDLFSMSNMVNMTSVSNIFMTNTPNAAINSTDVLSDIKEEKNRSNKY